MSEIVLYKPKINFSGRTIKRKMFYTENHVRPRKFITDAWINSNQQHNPSSNGSVFSVRDGTNFKLYRKDLFAPDSLYAGLNRSVHTHIGCFIITVKVDFKNK